MGLVDKINTFNCEICKKSHEFYRTIMVSEPDIISDMSDSEKKERLFIRNHLYLIDESIVYSKARLYINVENKSDFVTWELYVRLNSIEEYLDKIKDIRKTSPFIIAAKIESGIPLYEELENLEIGLVYNVDELDIPPRIKIPSGISLLAIESMNGISEKRLIELNKQLYHPNYAAT